MPEPYEDAPNEDRFTCMVEGCGQTFRSKQAKGQHRVTAHGKTPKTAFRKCSAAQRRAWRNRNA